MQWPSHYNHLAYQVPPASFYKQFLKMFNVHKACCDLGRELLYLGNYIYLYFFQFSDKTVIDFSHVQLWTPSRKRFLNIERAKFQIHAWNYGWLKSCDLNVWQKRNEITRFTPKLWFYDAFWLTSTKISKLGGNVR